MMRISKKNILRFCIAGLLSQSHTALSQDKLGLLSRYELENVWQNYDLDTAMPKQVYDLDLGAMKQKASQSLDSCVFKDDNPCEASDFDDDAISIVDSAYEPGNNPKFFALKSLPLDPSAYQQALLYRAKLQRFVHRSSETSANVYHEKETLSVVEKMKWTLERRHTAQAALFLLESRLYFTTADISNRCEYIRSAKRRVDSLAISKHFYKDAGWGEVVAKYHAAIKSDDWQEFLTEQQVCKMIPTDSAGRIRDRLENAVRAKISEEVKKKVTDLINVIGEKQEPLQDVINKMNALAINSKDVERHRVAVENSADIFDLVASDLLGAHEAIEADNGKLLSEAKADKPFSSLTDVRNIVALVPIKKDLDDLKLKIQETFTKVSKLADHLPNDEDKKLCKSLADKSTKPGQQQLNSCLEAINKHVKSVAASRVERQKLEAKFISQVNEILEEFIK